MAFYIFWINQKDGRQRTTFSWPCSGNIYRTDYFKNPIEWDYWAEESVGLAA
jgi:hypothetical protein